MTGTLQTPQINSPNSSEEAKIPTAVSTLNGLLTSGNLLDGAQLGATSVTAAALASNSVTTAKIMDANVTDAKLASPNNSVYRTVAGIDGFSIAAIGTGTYFLRQTVSNAIPVWTASGSGSPGSIVPLGKFDFASGDFTTTLTTRFRLRAQVFVGNTSPSTVAFNTGLYPLTIAANNYTLGPVVTGSQTGTSPTPALATNTISRLTGSDFAASALLTDPGTYIIGVIVGSITVPADVAFSAQLQMRST